MGRADDPALESDGVRVAVDAERGRLVYLSGAHRARANGSGE